MVKIPVPLTAVRQTYLALKSIKSLTRERNQTLWRKNIREGRKLMRNFERENKQITASNPLDKKDNIFYDREIAAMQKCYAHIP